MAARKVSPAKKATRTTRKATKRTTGRSQAKRAAPVKRAAKKATPAPAPSSSSLRTYRARQSVVGPNGRVRKGELVQLSPASGLAKSPFVSLVEDASPPADVAAALDDAG